jgi:hypothetical protein
MPRRRQPKSRSAAKAGASPLWNQSGRTAVSMWPVRPLTTEDVDNLLRRSPVTFVIHGRPNTTLHYPQRIIPKHDAQEFWVSARSKMCEVMRARGEEPFQGVGWFCYTAAEWHAEGDEVVVSLSPFD